jgi:hypothetical protein
MRVLIGIICLVALVSAVRADVPIDVSCTIDSFGSFPEGDAWTGHAESADSTPDTLTGKGEWTHELRDGRTFRGEVEFVRCRANGGVIASIKGRGRIHGAARNEGDPGLGIGHCIGKGHESVGAGCELLGPPGSATYVFRISARDDGDIDSYAFELRADEVGAALYQAGGAVVDNGEVVILPKN